MKKHTLTAIVFFATSPVLAEDTRQLDAHEHGTSTFDMAIDGSTVTVDFHAPGADIVGFEYAAESDADLAAIETTLETLKTPLDLFVFPSSAACTVTEARVDLESEHDDHEDHGHDHDHDAHDHADADHEAHAEEAGHTEFHASYVFDCENSSALTEIDFAFFEVFPNAKEVNVQLITASGAQAYNVESAEPQLSLGRQDV
ncbi:zinc uptake protein ZrgA [Aestuariibius insulae]|uniref:zinc uptake protein ZrgA n=1 Tax=Aestuariibius insulae TaxID=2058287 RepID=UPI00345E656E